MIYHHFTFNPILDNPLNCFYLELNKNLKVTHSKNYSSQDGLNKIFAMLNGFHTGNYNIVLNNETVLALYYPESASEARVTYDPSLNQVAITHNIFEKSVKIQTDSDSTLLNVIKKHIMSDESRDDAANQFSYALMGMNICATQE